MQTKFLAAALVLAYLLVGGTGTPALKAAEHAALHRLDFRVEGASCVGCLRRIGQKFRDSKGVFKADVSIYKPYWAIVIYDAKVTDLNKLKAAIADEHVKLVEVEDKSIQQIPIVIVPRGLDGPQKKADVHAK